MKFAFSFIYEQQFHKKQNSTNCSVNSTLFQYEMLICCSTCQILREAYSPPLAFFAFVFWLIFDSYYINILTICRLYELKKK